MDAKQFRAALKRIGISQNKAAALIGTDPRTARRWALDESPIPQSVAILLRLMARRKITIRDVERASVDDPGRR